MEPGPSATTRCAQTGGPGISPVPMLAIAPIRPGATCADVRALLLDSPQQPGVAVVDDGRPVGLVARNAFLASMAKPYWPEIYNTKPITRLMDANPLAVDLHQPIDQVSHLVVNVVPKAVDQGFIVTRDGRYAGIGTATDLMRLNARMASQRLEDLSQALRHVTEASQAKSSFLANVSHELRTPLNAILGFSDLLRRQLYGPLNGHQQEHVGYVYQSGTMLLELVNHLIDLSVAEAGRLDLRDGPVDLTTLVRDSLTLLGPHAESGGVTLGRGPLPSNVAIMADETKLKQILLNLLTNAIKFTRPGGTVTTSLTRTANGAIEVSVADTGIGIAAADQERVLEPFARAHDSRAHPAQGAGLGLPLAKVLTELHGGILRLDSTADVGTTVRVLLPAERVIAASARTAADGAD